MKVRVPGSNASYTYRIIHTYADDSPFQSNDMDGLVNHLGHRRRYSQFIRDWTKDLHINHKWPKLEKYKLIKSDYWVNHTVEGMFSQT